MNNIQKMSVAATITLLSGCASITNGTTQSLSVTTTPVQHAQCSLVNKSGIWYVNDTPGSVTVHRNGAALKVTCQKPGYKLASYDIPSNMAPNVAGNIILGGVIGAGADIIDGAAFNYPNEITIPLAKAHALASTKKAKTTQHAAANPVKKTQTA